MASICGTLKERHRGRCPYPAQGPVSYTRNWSHWRAAPLTHCHRPFFRAPRLFTPRHYHLFPARATDTLPGHLASPFLYERPCKVILSHFAKVDIVKGTLTRTGKGNKTEQDYRLATSGSGGERVRRMRIEELSACLSLP